MLICAHTSTPHWRASAFDSHEFDWHEYLSLAVLLLYCAQPEEMHEQSAPNYRRRRRRFRCCVSPFESASSATASTGGRESCGGGRRPRKHVRGSESNCEKDSHEMSAVASLDFK